LVYIGEGKIRSMAKLKVTSVEEATRGWQEGMLKTPALPCPVCGRKTRAKKKCQWCGAVFSK